MMYSYKKALTVGAVIFTAWANAQTLQDGIIAVDSHKYAKAREIFTAMSANDAAGENYFYLGNTFLTQPEPDYEKARAEFAKGLAKNPKSYLNRIGMSSIKLAKGDKSGITEIMAIVKDSREKDPEVLFRAAEALTMNEKASNADLAIEYLDKAIERSKKNIPAYYYYTMGDAYWLKKDAGKAMTAYENALPLAKNKASVYNRMAKLWMLAKQWNLAVEKMKLAITADPTYAPIYRTKADYDLFYQDNAAATQDLLAYEKYADQDPSTQLEIVKLYFTLNDFKTAQNRLNAIFDKVDDPIKYKLRAYLTYAIDKNFAAAKSDLDMFMNKVDPARIYPADKGLEGLLMMGLAKEVKDEAQKQSMLTEAQQKINIAKNANDKTLDWDLEITKVKGGSADSALADAGPSSPKVTELKQKIKDNPQDTNLMVELASEYQNLGNWNGALLTWQHIAELVPDWAYSYFGQAVAHSQLKNNDAAIALYQTYLGKIDSQPAETQNQMKDSTAYAYYFLAYAYMEKDKAKALEYINKSLQLKPDDADAKTLRDNLMK